MTLLWLECDSHTDGSDIPMNVTQKSVQVVLKYHFKNIKTSQSFLKTQTQ